MTGPAIISVAPYCDALAGRIQQITGGDILYRDKDFSSVINVLQEVFLAGRPLIALCASGIVIRALAPILADKNAEPPVLTLSPDGAHVVPLLGGHKGANRLAEQLAKALGGHAAITTAGDVLLGVALDDPPPGWHISEEVKTLMPQALSSGGLSVTGDEAAKATWLSNLPQGPDQPHLTATMAPTSSPALIPQRATLGVGCARGCPSQELADLVYQSLEKIDLSPKALAGIFTIDLKADEPAILDLARSLNLPLRFFTAAELEAMTPQIENPSPVVYEEVGCHSVAEAAAMRGAGDGVSLWQQKRKTSNATCAIALSPEPITLVNGRKRGAVMLVSAGPGQAAWRSPEAHQMVARADALVGYGLYIDLLGGLAKGKERHDFPLGGEEDRCRFALEEAAKGRDIALICSGDAGIYAMGALIYELVARAEDQGGVSRAAKAVEIISNPGISAFQAAAARAGAPIGHDFCTISLSDLLTPRATILQRLEAAAAGDFVIAFYNPVSRRRRELLDIAREILLNHRPAQTPVLLASNLGRPDETLKFRTLEGLQTDEVDMLTLVLIGSSQTKRIDLPDGPRLYTPRGYAKRIEEKLS